MGETEITRRIIGGERAQNECGRYVVDSVRSVLHVDGKPVDDLTSRYELSEPRRIGDLTENDAALGQILQISGANEEDQIDSLEFNIRGGKGFNASLLIKRRGSDETLRVSIGAVNSEAIVPERPIPNIVIEEDGKKSTLTRMNLEQRPTAMRSDPIAFYDLLKVAMGSIRRMGDEERKRMEINRVRRLLKR